MTKPGSGVRELQAHREPPRYKRAIVIWIALYPAVVVALTLLRPLIGDWPIPLQALALTLVVIPAAVWVLIPLAQRWLHGWLTSGPGD